MQGKTQIWALKNNVFPVNGSISLLFLSKHRSIPFLNHSTVSKEQPPKKNIIIMYRFEKPFPSFTLGKPIR